DPVALNSSLPSFVLPYFYYLAQGPQAGNATSAAAWSKSVGPGLVIGAIVALSLALAWWSGRTRRDTKQVTGPVTPEAAPVAVLPTAPIEGAPARLKEPNGANSPMDMREGMDKPKREDEAQRAHGS
ncbi:MAG TPA: hypothetical protein VGE04_17400, partial [Chloroflexia bacterium]